MRSIGIAIGIAMTVTVANPATGAEDWEGRFRTEGLAGLTALEAGMDELEVTIISEFSELSPRPRTLECLFRKPWYRVTVRRDRDLTDDPRILEGKLLWERVEAANSRYSFCLHKVTPKDPYIVASIGKSGQPMGQLTHIFYAQALHASWSLKLISLREGLNTARLKLSKVRPIQLDGKTYAVLDVAYGDKEEEIQAGLAPPFAGEIYLDPDQHWCICRATYTTFGRYQGRSITSLNEDSIEYGPPLGGLPMPKVVRLRTTTSPIQGLSDKPYTNMDTHTIVKIARRRAPEKEFSMSAFGLPEIGEPFPDDRSWLWLWLILLGFLFGCGAIAARWKCRRATA